MGLFRSWFYRIGNAGAVANAARACEERRMTEERIDVALRRITHAARQSLTASHPAPPTDSSGVARSA
jgi:hypothetical protein